MRKHEMSLTYVLHTHLSGLNNWETVTFATALVRLSSNSSVFEFYGKTFDFTFNELQPIFQRLDIVTGFKYRK